MKLFQEPLFGPSKFQPEHSRAIRKQPLVSFVVVVLMLIAIIAGVNVEQ